MLAVESDQRCNMSMWQLFLSAFSKENFANFSGVSSRREFWSFFLFYVLISYALNAVVVLLGQFVPNAEAIIWVSGALNIIWALGTIVPMLAMIVRRVRDTGASPWWLGVFITAQLVLRYWIVLSTHPWEVYVALVLSALLLVAWLWLLTRASRRFKARTY